MIEKKTMWAVTCDLWIEEKTALVEDGKVLSVKDLRYSKDGCYTGHVYNVLRYFDTKEDAEEYVADKVRYIRKMIPTVKEFIIEMDRMSNWCKCNGIKEEDYLGRYAGGRSDNDRKLYEQEAIFAEKLKTFIRSRMLNIGCHMIPIDRVRDVTWYGNDNSNSCCAETWKAVITTIDGVKVETASEADVRLVWATIGENEETYIVDNDIDYYKDESEE